MKITKKRQLAHSASLKALSNVETAQGFHLKRIR